ncbi:cellulose-growth-specific protein [Bisporella sp. PMI_857]|nr:cellulose-growth-specific protein [Bisporella sp. PMI_857]
MKAFMGLLIAAGGLVEFAAAHYRITSLIVNGQKTADYLYVRQNTNYNSPVTAVTSDDIRCNTGGLASGPSTSTAAVTAGSTIGFALDQSIFHPGPLQVYISKSTVADVKNYDGSGGWAKLASITATFSSGSVNWLASNLAQYTFTLPSSLAPGEYLLRMEHIALHSASTSGGAQFYISCGQIKVSGSGSGTPSPTIKLPGGYSASDPGILFNLNYPIPTAYTAPGPAVWRG